jgi:hypothetical protein
MTDRYEGPERRSGYIDETQAHTSATKAAREAVHEPFTTLGVDMSSTEKIIKAQRTFSFLYDWHASCQTIRKQMLIGLTTTGVGVVIAALVFYLKALGGPK